jgi:transcription elongation factor Elf1
MPYKDKEKQREKNREYQKKHYEQNKQYYVHKAAERKQKIRENFDKYKSTLKCEECGENHPACLDFHHIDPSKKDFSISQIKQYAWGDEKIEKEIKKCIVLCANCHRKYHYKEKMAGGGQGVPSVS